MHKTPVHFLLLSARTPAASCENLAADAYPPATPTAEQKPRTMGGLLSKAFAGLIGKKDVRILMVGLDAAGKTTLLYQLKLGEHTATVPTLGFNVETVAYKNIEFMVWDMGGQDKIRQLWSHYYEGTQALIFVVDSADAERMDEARQELHKLMEQEELKDAVLLVCSHSLLQGELHPSCGWPWAHGARRVLYHGSLHEGACERERSKPPILSAVLAGGTSRFAPLPASLATR